MQLEILISTCNDRLIQVPALLLPQHPDLGYIVVHQQFALNDNAATLEAEQALKARPDVKLIQSGSRGLAKSRNIALMAATAPLILLSDDDIHFEPSVLQIITQAFAEVPQADVMTFRFRKEGGVYPKRYPTKLIKRSYRNLFKVSSVEIALRREVLKGSGIGFDERFGLGAEYPVSEENIFLADLHKAGKPIYFYPADILVHPDDTSGANWDLRYLRARGALFKRVFSWYGLPLLLLFLLKHRTIIHSQAGIVSGVKAALKSFIMFSRKV